MTDAPDPDGDAAEALETRAAELAASVWDLRNAVASANAVRDELVVLSKRGKSNRRLITGLALSLFLDVALTVVLSLVIDRQYDNSSRLNDLTAQLTTDVTTQRVQALCPLDQILLNANSPAGRAAAAARGDDLAARDKAFKVIQQSYDALGCKAFITGGR